MAEEKPLELDFEGQEAVQKQDCQLEGTANTNTRVKRGQAVWGGRRPIRATEDGQWGGWRPHQAERRPDQGRKRRGWALSSGSQDLVPQHHREEGAEPRARLCQAQGSWQEASCPERPCPLFLPRPVLCSREDRGPLCPSSNIRGAAKARTGVVWNILVRVVITQSLDSGSLCTSPSP